MDLSNYHLTFNDDFNSFDSSPDGSHGWKTKFYFDGRSLPSNGEQGFYSDSSVGVDPFHLDNGSLVITAAPGSNPDGLAYNSGMISTEGDFTQTYGYFEIRAQLPEGQGMWPGFWMLKADKSWPPEIDILEAFGADNGRGEGGPNEVHVNAITHASGGGGDWVNIPGNIYNDYHTYGVDWQADTTTFYIDGQQVYSAPTPSDMHDPMYMLASLAVGGPWVGDAWGNSGDMKIDYIRAYSQDWSVPSVAGSDTGTDWTSGNATSGSDPASSDASGIGASSVTLHVSEDAWNGDAQFKVLVDGQQVGGTQTATADHGSGQSQDVTVNGDFGNGAHTVSVQFVNDAWGGWSGADRNLYVHSVDINGEHIAGNAANNNADNGGASADPGAAVMMVNGSADFHAGSGADSGSPSVSNGSSTAGSAGGESTLTLHVSNDEWSGNAQFTVSVDGQQVGGVQTATANHGWGQTQDITLTGNFGSLGPDKVDVHFINDAWGGWSGADRNLYVQSIDINGQNIAGSAANNNADNGNAWSDPGAAVMMTDGTATFDVHHSAPPDLWHV
jgi:beta-glucanase (GH16 family)